VELLILKVLIIGDFPHRPTLVMQNQK